MDLDELKVTVEGALLAAGQPLSLNQLNGLFPPDEQPGHGRLRQALAALDAELEGRAVELVEVASGFRLQVRTSLMPLINQLWTDKPPRYSRALLETLAIIAYRQPITRGEIEQIRGVSLSTNILRTLQERDWIKVVGHRDVPGRPELLGTTRSFLDYFNLQSLDELPTLAEIKDLDNLEPELEFNHPDRPPPAETTETSGAEDDPQKARGTETRSPPAGQSASEEQTTEARAPQVPPGPEHGSSEDDGAASEPEEDPAGKEAHQARTGRLH